MNLRNGVLTVMAHIFSIMPAGAATLCVSSAGNYPCYTRIGDAVNAAAAGDVIQVGPGTYYESVTITQPLSLTTENAIVDATGLGRGFFVNGGISQDLGNVNISGFTVRNAQFEGVLVLNTSMATISNNTVINNNQAVQGGSVCVGIDTFESGETADCGQGIHLMGADHSVVTNNTVQNNAGGILLSDESGATHDNLVSFNNISNNPYASGITLASHAAALEVQVVRRPGASAAQSAITANAAVDTGNSYGVYHNTVYGNRSRDNGLANGAGAGVGLFASVFGSQTYGNVVVANYLAENSLPGVAMHAPAAGQTLNDNVVVGNTIINNGADTGDAATLGPTGVNVYAIEPATGNMILGNSVQQESLDVAVNVPAPVQVQFNALQGNGIGVANLGSFGPVIATENFWSCPNGPTIPGSCSLVFGSDVQWAPWLILPVPVQPSF